MTSGDYLAAIGRPRVRPTLSGRVPETPWDPPLELAVKDAGVAVYEEELRGELLHSML